MKKKVDEYKKSSALYQTIVIIILLLVFVVMLVFNLLTPMAGDDYAHYFGMEGKHVTRLCEIFRNMKLFRSETNGRVLPHFLVYVFLAIPREVFCILNAFVAVLIVYLMMRFFFEEDYAGKNLLLLAGEISALWLFTPAYGEIYLSRTGAVNYSWGLALDMAFLYPFYCHYIYEKKEKTGETTQVKTIAVKKSVVSDSTPIIHQIFFCILAFITGAWSENGGIAVLCTAGMTGIMIWIEEKKLPKYLFTAFLFALLGFAFLMTAPATSGRTVVDVFENIWYLRVLIMDFLPVLMGVYLLLLLFAIIAKINIKIIVFTIILIIAAGVSLAVFIFAAYIPNRSFMIAVSFITLANLLLLSQILRKRIGICAIAIPAAAIVLFLYVFPKGAKDIYGLYQMQMQRDEIISTAVAAGEKNVILPRFVTETDYPACSEEELLSDSTYWYNDLVAKYYGIMTVTAEQDK